MEVDKGKEAEAFVLEEDRLIASRQRGDRRDP